MERYQIPIQILKSAGYHPIAVTSMMFEDTFVFETKDEAKRAYQELEKEKKQIQGWFYGWPDFLLSMDDHKKKFGKLSTIYFDL
jgi:hypothetical protein